MRYKKCKLVCGLMVCALMMTSVTACGTNTTESSTETESTTEANTFAYTDGTEEEPVSTTVMAKVDSVDGNEVTLSVGGGMGAAPDGNAGGDGTEEPPLANSTSGKDESNQNESDGNAQQTPGEMTQASALLTINDESVIKVQDSENNTTDGSLSDITEGTMLQITFDEEGNITEITVSQGMGGDMAGGQPGGQPGGSASGVDSYDAVTEYAEDTEVDGENYSSTGTDENAILVSSGATATLKNITVDRTSSDSTGGDNSSFYGVGAAVLTTDGTTYIKNADITTNAAGGGTLYAWDLNVETQGESSAAIRSDRGGGTMVVDGGTYTSNGTGSPAVYCTADIAVNNATLTANGSEAICMEGLNTIHLFDCDITGDMQDLSQNDTTWTIIVYQSMSGDSEVGNSTMQIVGGSLTSKNGGLIYTTNTEANILLSDVDITYSDDSEITNLYNEGTIVDVDGKTISIVGTDGTIYVEGTSSYTITVEKYSDSADFSGAVEADSWTNHEVAKPEEIA